MATPERVPVQPLFTASSVPGLLRQTSLLQAGEGLRLRPSIAGDFVRLYYLLQFQQFITAGDAPTNFRRWSVDLGHEIPIYRKVLLVIPNDRNSPDSCAAGSGITSANPCPHVSVTQNL